MARPRRSAAVPPRTALQNELVDRINELIRTSDPAPGGRVREAWLSRTLGVSRTPIQAALQHLLQAGVLTRHPKGGYLVASTPLSAKGSLGGAGDGDLYGRMLRDIITGDVPDGVSESALMRVYGAGRGEILQALRRLMREGLAEPLPGRGWSLLSLDGEQLARSYHLRGILEPAILADRAYRPDPDALRHLRAEHEAALASLTGETPWQDLFELDARFHETLARGTGNEMIVDIMRRQNRLRRLAEFVSYVRLDRVRQSMLEHLAILDALSAGDSEWASALMRRHLAVSRQETEAHFDRDRVELGTSPLGLTRVA